MLISTEANHKDTVSNGTKQIYLVFLISEIGRMVIR